MLEPAQIRAARALLGWRQEDLSKASNVGTATIQRIEKSDSPIAGYVSTLWCEFKQHSKMLEFCSSMRTRRLASGSGWQRRRGGDELQGD